MQKCCLLLLATDCYRRCVCVNWFAVLKDYYNNGFYDDIALKVFVVRGKITDIQYKEISGIDYVA